jgi:hypothetical protein
MWNQSAEQKSSEKVLILSGVYVRVRCDASMQLGLIFGEKNHSLKICW